MHFTSYASMVALFCGTVLSEGIVFDPILKPTEGEVLQAGSNYEIQWTSTENKPVQLSLHDHKADAQDKETFLIKDSLPSKDGKFDWTVDTPTSKNGTYFIKIALVDDVNTFSYSPGFKIHSNGTSSSNSSSTATGTATGTATTSASMTASMTASGSSGSTTPASTSTSHAGANMATAAPLAFLGAAALGVLAF